VHVVLSCEHGGNEVPAPYAALFDRPEARSALKGHRGWDPGSLEMGRAMQRELGCPLQVQTVTRLLVECNRSADHGSLWSEFSKELPPDRKAELRETVWRAHRGAVEDRVRESPPGPVLHIGVHSFTPTWKGRERRTDIGILFDPRRMPEARLARRWREEIRRRHPELALHLNRPYRGWTDGLTTTLRGTFVASRYLGLELEFSQVHVIEAARLGVTLAQALDPVLSSSQL